LEPLLGVHVAELRSIAGGDINQAYRATLATGERAFVKTRPNAPKGMYAREAEGLAWLAEPKVIRIPNVRAVTHELLVLEWVERGTRADDYDEQLGRGLAALHRTFAAGFGLDVDNFIGSLPQANRPLPSWAEFYWERRLSPLLEKAGRQGLLASTLRRRFDALHTRLDQLVGAPEPPARLHGDLWSGNLHADDRGAPVLIDPAVYGGHREVDLAMLQLFGSPSPRFFAAYDEVYPLQPDPQTRAPLYQLYPLLVHVCLFGAGYLGQLEYALRRAEGRAPPSTNGP
jgi:fructosamine-3-kinase